MYEETDIILVTSVEEAIDLIKNKLIKMNIL